MAKISNIFLNQLNKNEPEQSDQRSEEGSSNLFLKQLKSRQIPESEGILKSALRYGAQVPLGAAELATSPLNILQAAGVGEALSEYDELQERLPELKKKFPNAPWENFEGLDREKYMKAVQEASESFPTQQNVEKLIERKTGLPLEAKTAGQKLLRFGSSAGASVEGNLAKKATAGVVAPAVKEGAAALGIPEPIADIVGLGASGKVNPPTITKEVKPSGLTKRRTEEADLYEC